MSSVAWNQLLRAADADGHLVELSAAIEQADAMAKGMPAHTAEPVRAAWLLVGAAFATDERTRQVMTAAATIVALAWHDQLRANAIVAEFVTDDGYGHDPR